MRRLAIVLTGFFLLFLQAQLLPALFHTNWVPNVILTAVIVVTVFKGQLAGLTVAVVGGGLQDILISNFFGLHLFPYSALVYILSIVQQRVYEERWYWTCIIVAISTLLDGIMRIAIIAASGGEIEFLAYMWHMILPTLFWNVLLGAVGHWLLQSKQEEENYFW